VQVKLLEQDGELYVFAQCRATIRVRKRDDQDENPPWGDRRRA
jgi:hypothetical protein